jgi:VanZ family protein
MTDGRRAVLLAALVVALSALALLARFPSNLLIFADLNNAAHAPVFGALAIVWLHVLGRYSALGPWQRYLAAFALAFAIGGLIELIQPAMRREAEILDLVNDALGAIAGLAIAATIESRRKWVLLVGVAALLPVLWPIGNAAMAYRSRSLEFPSLLGNNTLADRYFLHSFGVELAPAVLPVRWRRSDDPLSLRIRIRGTRFPRITHREPQTDWRGYERLMLDITNPGVQPLTLTLSVHERGPNNRALFRFRQTFTVSASTRRVVSISLAEIAASPRGRGMDMSRIATVILFGKNGSDLAGREYYLTRLWLE